MCFNIQKPKHVESIVLRLYCTKAMVADANPMNQYLKRVKTKTRSSGVCAKCNVFCVVCIILCVLNNNKKTN